jgi:hypothetical protein
MDLRRWMRHGNLPRYPHSTALIERNMVLSGEHPPMTPSTPESVGLGLLAVRGPRDAVPVRVSAAAGDTEHPLRGWLVEA